MDNRDFIDLASTGIVKPECVKKVTGLFCRAIEHENADDLLNGYETVLHKVSRFSVKHSEKFGIRPIRPNEDLLEYFFNQRNTIPAYVYYWLKRYYNEALNDTSNYDERYYYIYNALQKEYVRRRRFIKNSNKEVAVYKKKHRRQISKMLSGGKYSTTFEMYNKPLETMIDFSELDSIADMLICLFGKTFNGELTDDNFIGLAYCLGRIQGRSEIQRTAAPIVTA